VTPTIRDATPEGEDPKEWDLTLDGAGGAGRFGPLGFGPLGPVQEAILRLLLVKRTVAKTEIGSLLGRHADDASIVTALEGLRLWLPLLAAARISRVGAWGFRYRPPQRRGKEGGVERPLADQVA
jgi:hypothetical protein